MYGSSRDRGRFDTSCNITQGLQELQRYNCVCGLIAKSSMIKHHQLLSKVMSINGKSRFDQLATAPPLPHLKPNWGNVWIVKHKAMCDELFR